MVDNDKIWKDIIDRMKNCIQVWKSRKLSYKGKTIIVKNLLLFSNPQYDNKRFFTIIVLPL
jgi:hypothetical protein